MMDQSLQKLESENIYQQLMRQGIAQVKLEKSEKAQIWADLKKKRKNSNNQAQEEQELAKELVEFQSAHAEYISAKTISEFFTKSVQVKVQAIYQHYFDQIIKLQSESKMKSDLNLSQYNSAYFQNPSFDTQQIKYFQQVNSSSNPSILGMQMNQIPTNQTPLLYNTNFFNSLYPQNPTAESLVYPYSYFSMPNQFMHPQSNQGVPQLSQTYMYNKPHEISGINTTAYATNPQSYINQLGLQSSVGYSIPFQQYMNPQQATVETNQIQLDAARGLNYLNSYNGFTKGLENPNYQEQLMQIQAANQPAQQQKIAQNQKQIQAPYPLQNQQQQQQFQIQQQYLQAQLPQQQQLQAQSQQRQTNQPTAQKSKQAPSTSNLSNTSQPNQTFGLAISGGNGKQVQSTTSNTSSTKNSKLGVSEITPQSQKQSTSQSKSKSKSSNNSSAINLLQQTQIPMNNNQQNLYSHSRNGAIPNQAKGIETEAIKSCICAQVPRLRNNQSELIQCKNKGCEHKLHLSCMRISPKDEESISQFECPSCILKKYDPLHHVEQTLIDCQVIMGMPNKQLDFQLSSETFAKIRDHSEFCVEIRCIRIDGTKNIYETTWPDYGNLKMNNEVILELKPLQNNSSLKKRKDEKQTFKGVRNLKEGTNHLLISEFNCNVIEKQQFRIADNALHCVSVFIIRKLSVEQLVANIKRDSTRPAQECKQQIQDYFNRQNKKSSHEEDDDEICIDSLSVPLTCSLDMKLIQTPAKGLFCKHFQCFSLENFIITTETVNPRKWKCNICKAKCYDIVVDEFILKIIQEIHDKQIKNVTDVKFDSKGQHSFDQQSYSDDDDDYDDDSKPIVKKASQNQSINPQSAAPQPITVSPTNPPTSAASMQQVIMQNQLINKGQTNGSNIPKGVNLESHSNSNALESMQAQQIPEQVGVTNKKKQQQILVIDSDEDEPPIQKKPQQTSVLAVPQAALQMQQQTQQNGQSHHHHHLNQANFSATNVGLNLTQVNPNLNGHFYKNLQNINSHQTSNTAAGFNTVNSQNINQMIPLINKDKDQSSNQSPKNIITKSKKTVMCEDENKDTSKLQNQTNKNNNNQQKTPSNHKEQKLNSEEVQREIQINKKNIPGNIASGSTNLSVSLLDQTKQMAVYEEQLSKYNYNKILENEIKETNQRLAYQISQKQINQQNNLKRVASNQDQPILIDSPKSSDLLQNNSLQSQAKALKLQQQNAQQKMSFAQKNAMSLVNMIQKTDPQQLIGLNNQEIQKQMIYTSMQKYQPLEHIQKMEELSVSGDQSKSLQNVVLSDKDIQNLERKRIQNEQSLEQSNEGNIQYFEDLISIQGQNGKFGSQQDLSSKQKQSLNNSTSGSNQGTAKKTQQTSISINNIIVKTLQSNQQSETVPIQFELQSENNLKRKIVEQNTSNKNDGLNKKRIFEKITNIGKEDNPITIDD